MNEKTKSIAWIDDEKFDFKTHVHWLEKNGLNVTFFDTVSAALKQINGCEQNSWPFHLTIFDINLKPGPGEDRSEADSAVAGIGLLERFREKFPKEHVLVLSNVLWHLEPGERDKLIKEKQKDKLELDIDTLPDYFFKLSGSPRKPDLDSDLTHFGVI